ncbi:protein Mpv17-like [Paramacrobiotus metropolitanus]|uniref:protein Mpv17-like n=1 Tax=Paramacrobiotus metropolitanus TaxID=2943436 RepID=UPI0024456CEA|nr:protein Mpv17-like [Paramacrobiotus metropolitanus]
MTVVLFFRPLSHSHTYRISTGHRIFYSFRTAPDRCVRLQIPTRIFSSYRLVKIGSIILRRQESKGFIQNLLRLASTDMASNSAAAAGSPISRAWQKYLRYTDANPLKVQALTALIFAAMGNLISQTLVEKKGLTQIDLFSTARFTAIAVFYSFPIVRCWLWVLENKVKPGKFAPIKRVLLDQLVFAPINYIVFIAVMGLVEGDTWEAVQRRLKNDYWSVMFSNWKLWPAVQLINFYFVPFNQRILFLSVVSLFWNTYLAYVVRQGGGEMGTMSKNATN